MQSILDQVLKDADINRAYEQVLRKRSDFLENANMLNVKNDVDLQKFIANELAANSPKRLLFGLVGFPASGKTSFSNSIERISQKKTGISKVMQVSMDGFHHRIPHLEKVGLIDRKGSLETYDIDKLNAFLRQYLGSGRSSLFAPVYDRSIHEVVENAKEIHATCSSLVIEGIYVGYDKGPWEYLSSNLEKLFFLDTHPMTCINRIVERNIQVGRDEETIFKKIKNDLGFMMTASEIALRADLVIRLPS